MLQHCTRPRIPTRLPPSRVPPQHRYFSVPSNRSTINLNPFNSTGLKHKPLPHKSTRHLTTSPPTMSSPQKDWSANQYLKFRTERTRPVYDLVSQITPLLLAPTTSTSSSSQITRKLRIHDLGCGPGNSTQVLYDTFPGARITGMDSSADMLSKANATFSKLQNGDVDFIQADLATYTLPNETTDLVFSNAAFHWLPSPHRIPTLTRLFTSLPQSGVIAIQMPDNYHAPTHTLMRLTASLPGTPWSSYFANTRIGDISDPTRPDLDPIESPGEFYNALSPLATGVNVWRTEYMHVLDDARGIVEWVKGTGLQPYLNRIGDDEGARRGFLEEYERRLKEAYPVLGDGKVMLGYPRLFVVAVRK
ncbi:trans-aconitate 2-methyltransferase [Paraphoma chrysanthemicola]|uniref:Trans-aconitate 2-methyltransferase n=1 Tax=Paraphoma chrysanthemicola TaxID=798071 RepID=A0A8K0QSM0_9PLEO|nr:trans-aconitate 2-methyltransferase [Paraphoma chrysanthemicola]